MFFDMSKNRIPRNAEIHKKFRCHDEPLLMPPSSDVRRWPLQRKMKYFEAEDMRAINRAADEVDAVKAIEFQRNKVEKKRILLDNLRGEDQKDAVRQAIAEQKEFIRASVQCWGTASSTERNLTIGSCMEIPGLPGAAIPTEGHAGALSMRMVRATLRTWVCAVSETVALRALPLPRCPYWFHGKGGSR